jgi:hypothetical protein
VEYFLLVTNISRCWAELEGKLLCRGRRVYRGTCRLEILISTQEESQNDFNMVAKAYALLSISRHSDPKALK